MSAQDIKLNLIETILQVKEDSILKQINGLVQELLKKDHRSEEYDAHEMTFEKWNEQFTDRRDLNEFVPEYGMTIGSFRRKIYEAEKEEERPIEEFFNYIDKRTNDLKAKSTF